MSDRKRNQKKTKIVPRTALTIMESALNSDDGVISKSAKYNKESICSNFGQRLSQVLYISLQLCIDRKYVN